MKAGIGHYTAGLLRSLAAHAGGQVESFPAGWIRRAVDLYSRARPALDTHQPGAEASGPPRPWRRWRGRLLQAAHQAAFQAVGWQFRAQCRRRRYDLYHEPNTIPLPVDLPTLSTIHDLSLLLHPEWHTLERVGHFEKHLRRALDQCRHFLTDTDFIRDEAIRVLGIAPERITRVYIGIRDDLRPLPAAQVQAVLRKLELPEQYLLYVGTIEPRKNLLMLLQVYCTLPASVRERWPFVLVGKWGWNAREVADYLQHTARHQGVRHLGYLADEHVAALYNGARALVYPSHYEGFGLPPLEMMSCGGAVLASTAGSVAEIASTRAHLIDPHDADSWRAALLRITSDNDWWHSLRQGVVEHARSFSWDRCARETFAVYQAILGQVPALRRAG
ncbi:MAG: glycosyltransferase family 4 protein [Gemmataceae bacterium]